MPTVWSFEHSIETQAARQAAWRFWSEVANWARVDSALEWVRLDGPFVSGAKGMTKPRDHEATQWRLVQVVDATRAVIEIDAPGAVLRCIWLFEDRPGGGTRITQKASLEGEQAADYLEAGRELEAGIPAGMRQLACAIDSA